MLPKLYKLKKTHPDYKYGFRWGCTFRDNTYSVLTRTFKAAFRHWWYELKNTPNLYRRIS